MCAMEGFTNFPDSKSKLEHIDSFKEDVNKIVYTADSYMPMKKKHNFLDGVRGFT